MRKGIIEQEDLDKHLPIIIFHKNLEDLTASQIKSVALLMESSYRKGIETEKSGAYTEDSFPTALIKPGECHENRKHSVPCEKCNEKGASNLHNVVINIQTDKVIEGVVERITKDLDKIIANKVLY